MRTVVVLLVCVLGACVQPNVVHCADGRTCPGGTVCTDLGLCALPVQLTVCVGQEEGTPCTYPGAVGACISGVCYPVGCGNGVREPTEACDDGNLVSGDGCSSDCQSNEECGDGDANPFLGEECDDQNHLDHDGCSSSCLREELLWTRIDNGPPLPRRGAAIAYDSLRRRVILFGGTGPANERYNDTWEWDGAQWTRMAPVFSPPARQNSAMAFDPTRGRVVLFGGLGNGAFSDTWEYLGTTWRVVSSFQPPMARYGHQLAYDGIRKRVVLVGGTNIATVFNDAYAWSGTDWEPLPSLPRPRVDHAMAFDAARGQLVLFSGREGTTSNAIDDAWTLNATGWSPLPAPGQPRLSAGAAYDPVNGRVVIYGGSPDGTYGNAVATVTTWNGTAWSHATIPGAPSARLQTAVTYDVASRVVLVFGGYLQQPQAGYDNTTFTYGTAWAAPPLPIALDAGSLSGAWDPDRAIGLVAGPGTTSGAPVRTYRWSGAMFQLTAAGPSARTSPLVAWDRSEIILAGGQLSGFNPPPTDTWSWNGSWMSRASGAPFPRYWAAMAADPQGLVLFGGRTPMSTLPRSETWLWRSGAWTQAAPASMPPAVEIHAMAYDPRRRSTLLYGGATAAGDTSTETWEWDGASWLRLDPILPAPRRKYHRMYDDPNRKRTMAMGSVDGAGTAELLEWDGTNWAPISAENPGPPMGFGTSAVFYDPPRHGALVVTGGPSGLWLLRYQSRSNDETCWLDLDRDQDGLVGCADPDCWYVCTPHCSPGMTCDNTLPHCGDSSCNTAVEDCRSCPGDCGACTPICGDAICDPGETCLGDC